MMKKNVYIAVAAMMMMGVSGTANAAWTEGAPTVNVANESTATIKGTQKPLNTTAAGLTFSLGALAQGSLVTISLTNGATFKANPKATNVTATARTLVLQGTAVGSKDAVFSAANAAGITANDSITIADATAGEIAINVTAVPANGAVDVTYKATTSNGAVSLIPLTSLKGTTASTTAFLGSDLVKLVPAISSSAVTAAGDIAQVAGGYKDVNSANNKVGAASVIMLKSDAPLAFANDSFLITLSGNFAGVKSISAVNAGLLTSSTSAGLDAKLDSTAGTTVADQFSINAAKTFAYARTVANPNAAGKDYGFKVTYDGTAQSARVFQVKVDSLSTSGGTAALVNPVAVQALANVVNITRNGASAVSGNIGAASRVRLTNNSGAAAAYSVTGRDASGAAVTLVGAAVSGSVPANGTVDIVAGALTTAYPTATAFDFNVESDDVVITHIKKNASGLNTNTYRNNTGNGGSL